MNGKLLEILAEFSGALFQAEMDLRESGGLGFANYTTTKTAALLQAAERIEELYAPAVQACRDIAATESRLT